MILSNPFFLLVLAVCIFVAVRVLLYKTGLVYIVKKWWRAVEDCFHVYQSFKVPEFNESMQENQLYCKVTVYLNSLTSIEDSDFTNLVTGKKPNEIVLQLDPNQTIEDDFLGAKVTWQSEASKGGSNNCRNLVLKVRKADKRRILRPYLQHIHVVADELDQRKRDLRLYMNVDDSATAGDDFRNARWRAVPFTHPSTLETIAMEADLKSKIKSDLESFLKAKQYYNRLGRVWKRSFLLYGPSGTGKSSFVAAMANFLGYDVYDLDLSRVRDDSELKMLLLQTTSKSVILIEDLDRFFAEKSTAVSFSGISNFMDGLLNSCCAEERVMVFTMNSKDQVDPNFLRPGRIDVHIHFPLCDFTAFRNLATSYLGVKEHKLFPQVEEIFQSGSSLSPAEIGELMIANRNSPSRAIKSVITALQTDGDGRGRGRSDGRRWFESGSRKSGGDESGEPGVVLCGEGVNTVRDFRKLYGFLRMRGSKNSQSFDAGSDRSAG
ncbi:LOW QUALITY PROTEIN: AAA-ATPase At2g46620 [Rosa chinensis]|uniref:LOW QUALITY PROTEIN: AAA-ATPase At2g46620 n=1 Tax=Rosa chinensis TaxID=74649 RepID=UPI000D0887F9|nr:LOW QUALITY PROTEIN: AAA-ATPase At2g46620 [Rosa chinensis]